MKNLFPSFARLAAVAVCALSLGSCNRAEYAMLPKGGSYHGVSRPATPVHATPAMASTPAPVAEPVVATAPTATPKTAENTSVAPAAKSLGTATVVTAPVAKLNLVQRVALKKVARKVENMTQKSGSARQHDNTAATQKLEGKLRQGIILVAIGVLVEILGIVLSSSIVYLLGAILIIVGGVFIVLYLIDKL